MECYYGKPCAWQASVPYLLYPLEADAGGSVIQNYGSGYRMLNNYGSTGSTTLFGTVPSLPDGMLFWQTLCLTCFCISCIHWKLMLDGLTMRVAPDWTFSPCTQQCGHTYSPLPTHQMFLSWNEIIKLSTKHNKCWFQKASISGIFSFSCTVRYSTLLHLRPSHSTVSEDAGIELRTVATMAMTARRSSHSAIFIHYSARSYPLISLWRYLFIPQLDTKLQNTTPFSAIIYNKQILLIKNKAARYRILKLNFCSIS